MLYVVRGGKESERYETPYAGPVVDRTGIQRVVNVKHEDEIA